MFRSMYTAASGMTAQQLNLDNIANNLANSSTAGYASAQVDKKKIGQLAVAIQTAFQQMGVFRVPERAYRSLRVRTNHSQTIKRPSLAGSLIRTGSSPRCKRKKTSHN
jgi:flagellar basal body rod protein FlgG